MTLYCANENCIYYEMQRTNGRVEDGSCVRPNVQISESGCCEDKKLKYDGFKLCTKCGGAGYIKIPGVLGQERCYECDRLGYIKEVKLDESLLEIGRKAVEDALVDFRDSRISLLNRGNGLVIREKDGTASSIIRMGTEDALRIGFEAIEQFIQQQMNLSNKSNSSQEGKTKYQATYNQDGSIDVYPQEASHGKDSR